MINAVYLSLKLMLNGFVLSVLAALLNLIAGVYILCNIPMTHNYICALSRAVRAYTSFCGAIEHKIKKKLNILL